MPTLRATPAIDRLLRRLDCSGDCWLWPGATNGRGYGVIGESEPVRRMVYVHRVMYQHAFGPVPPGMEVCHRCDVRNCCRPEHLFAATHAQNIADQVAKGRNRKGRQMYWSAKLDEDDVRAIRSRHEGGETAAHLAREYGVSASQAEFIVNRKRWAHVA